MNITDDDDDDDDVHFQCGTVIRNLKKSSYLFVILYSNRIND